MSPVRLFWQRGIGQATGALVTGLEIALFVSVTAVLTVFGIDAAEGGTGTLVSVWTASASRVLPVLAAFLAMDAWSGERRSGRDATLLSVDVSETAIVCGKYLGVLTLMFLSLVLSLAAVALPMSIFSTTALNGIDASHVVFALLSLTLQGLLWCAVGVMTSCLFARAAAAAAAAILVTVALPQGIWLAMLSWFRDIAPTFGDSPIEATSVDLASGSFSLASATLYPILAALALFIAVRAVVATRYVGRAARRMRWSSRFAVVLAVVLAALVQTLAYRFDVMIDVPSFGSHAEFSGRTRRILADADGDLTITCYLSRHDSRFRAISHLLRSLKRESSVVGGARIALRYVDPRWDLSASERLVRYGVAEESLVFEKGRRVISVPLKDGFSERLCASTIRRLTVPTRRRHVYWTTGHGESSVKDYGEFGLSDIARELSRDGYANSVIDLVKSTQIPGDCALIAVAGAKNGFSRAELALLEDYLNQGGRLLVMTNEGDDCGVAPVLSTWGVRSVPRLSAKGATVTGADVIITDFPGHPVTERFRNARVIFSHPCAFVQSAAADAGSGADRIGFSAVARSEGAVLSAAVERGSGAGSDLAVRPTRLMVIGDASFVQNAPLGVRAGANRDFFLNAVAYLTGDETVEGGEGEVGKFASGLDRRNRLIYLYATAGGIPLAILMVFAAVALRRRSRR